MIAETKPTAAQKAIVAITHAVSQGGIAKGSKNKEQGYNYRGIDDVLNALAPLYAANNIFVRPRVLKREVTLSATKSGNPLWKVTVEVEYTVVSCIDGSEVSCITYGEAMDSADKATNKALSAAYKYLAIQLFAIPVEGTPDADANTPEPAPVITDNQAAEIRNLAKAAGVDESSLLTWVSDKAGYDITTIDGIPPAAFEPVTASLKKRANNTQTEGAAA